jgi:hypothetical protein
MLLEDVDKTSEWKFTSYEKIGGSYYISYD